MSEAASAPATGAAPAAAGTQTQAADTGKQGNAGTPPHAQTAQNAGASKSATPAAEKLYEVKVNGKVVKMTEREMMDRASMSTAAADKFNEAKQLNAKVQRIISTAKTNPINALMDPELGLSKEQIRDAFEKWYHQEFIEAEKLTPDQKELRAAKARLAEIEEREKKAADEAEQQRQNDLTAKEREYLQNQIIEAMDKSGLPKIKFFVQRMAFYMRQNLNNGWQAPVEHIIRQVKEERAAIISDVVAESDIPRVLEMFGEDFINKLRKHDLEQLRARRQIRPPTTGGAGTGTATQPGEKIYSSEVTRNLRRMRLGK